MAQNCPYKNETTEYDPNSMKTIDNAIIEWDSFNKASNVWTTEWTAHTWDRQTFEQFKVYATLVQYNNNAHIFAYVSVDHKVENKCSLAWLS
jgi:hypothetical protein